MVTRIVIALTLLLVGCGGDGGDDSSDDNTLHLHGVDLSEADFRSDLLADPQAKAALCFTVSQGREEFITNAVRASEELVARPPAVVPTLSANETPRPGQKVDRESAERVYAIVKDVCG